MSYGTISLFTVGRLNTGYQVPKYGFRFSTLEKRRSEVHDARLVNTSRRCFSRSVASSLQVSVGHCRCEQEIKTRTC
jgi:hypothetical protein